MSLRTNAVCCLFYKAQYTQRTISSDGAPMCFGNLLPPYLKGTMCLCIHKRNVRLARRFGLPRRVVSCCAFSSSHREKRALSLAKFPRKFRASYDYDNEPCDTSERRTKPRYALREETFKCRHCRRFVCPVPSGGQHRNHCPFCLYSRHVDDRIPGDRASTCGASMSPIGTFQRPDGEHVIVHRCLTCEIERFNRIAGDDDFDLVLSLPLVPPRTSRSVKAAQWQD